MKKGGRGLLGARSGVPTKAVVQFMEGSKGKRGRGGGRLGGGKREAEIRGNKRQPKEARVKEKGHTKNSLKKKGIEKSLGRRGKSFTNQNQQEGKKKRKGGEKEKGGKKGDDPIKEASLSRGQALL